MRTLTAIGGIAHAQSLARLPCAATRRSIVSASVVDATSPSVVPTQIIYDRTSSVIWIIIPGIPVVVASKAKDLGTMAAGDDILSKKDICSCVVLCCLASRGL